MNYDPNMPVGEYLKRLMSKAAKAKWANTTPEQRSQYGRRMVMRRKWRPVKVKT